MTLEEHVKALLGDLLFNNLVLHQQIEEVQERLQNEQGSNEKSDVVHPKRTSKPKTSR